MSGDSQLLRVQRLLDRLNEGDLTARDSLLDQTFERLTRLARVMLRDYPGVRRWEETDDVMQRVSIRLHRGLAEVALPSPKDFFRLAAVQIRRELTELARRYAGPHGLGTKHESHDSNHGPGLAAIATDDASDPSQLAEWSAFHEQAGALPGILGSVFDLVYYQGLTQAEAAEILGVSERQVKRYWRDARLALHEAVGGQLPGF